MGIGTRVSAHFLGCPTWRLTIVNASPELGVPVLEITEKNKRNWLNADYGLAASSTLVLSNRHRHECHREASKQDGRTRAIEHYHLPERTCRLRYLRADSGRDKAGGCGVSET